MEFHEDTAMEDAKTIVREAILTGLCPGEAAVPPRCTSPLGAPQGTNSGSIPIRLDCTGLPAPQVRPFQVRYTGM